MDLKNIYKETDFVNIFEDICRDEPRGVMVKVMDCES